MEGHSQNLNEEVDGVARQVALRPTPVAFLDGEPGRGGQTAAIRPSKQKPSRPGNGSATGLTFALCFGFLNTLVSRNARERLDHLVSPKENTRQQPFSGQHPGGGAPVFSERPAALRGARRRQLFTHPRQTGQSDRHHWIWFFLRYPRPVRRRPGGFYRLVGHPHDGDRALGRHHRAH